MKTFKTILWILLFILAMAPVWLVGIVLLG